MRLFGAIWLAVIAGTTIALVIETARAWHADRVAAVHRDTARRPLKNSRLP